MASAWNPTAILQRVVHPSQMRLFSSSSSNRRHLRDAFNQAGQKFMYERDRRTEIKANKSTQITTLPSGLVFLDHTQLKLPQNLTWEHVMEKHESIFGRTAAELQDEVDGQLLSIRSEGDVTDKTGPYLAHPVHNGLEAVLRELHLHKFYEFGSQEVSTKEDMSRLTELFGKHKLEGESATAKGNRPDKTMRIEGMRVGPHDAKAPVAIREEILKKAGVRNLAEAKQRIESGEVRMRKQTADKKSEATSLLDHIECTETERNLCRQAVKYMVQQDRPFCEVYDDHSIALFMVEDIKALKDDYVLYVMILTEQEKSTLSKPVNLEDNHVRFSTTLWANAIWRLKHGKPWIQNGEFVPANH